MRVTFSLRFDLPPKDVGEILGVVRRIGGVSHVAPINPSASNAVARSQYFVDLTPGSNPDAACESIRKVDGVRSCSIPAARYAL